MRVSRVAQIEVLATDGKIQKRIIWIDVKRRGVYAGWCEKNRDFHFSYHSDGNVFRTINGKREKIATFQPLDKFKGIHQIASFAFSSDLSKLRVPSYRMNKLRAVTYIDVRYFVKEKCDVGCNVSLLEPNRFELLHGLTKIPTTEIHIFTQFNPWILIDIYKVKTDCFNQLS